MTSSRSIRLIIHSKVLRGAMNNVLKSCVNFKLWGVVSDSKMNLVGVLGGHFLKFPIVFKNEGKKQKKIKEKREFLLFYRQIDFCIWFVIYIQLNFQKFLTFFDSNVYEICRKRKNLQD
ncbi:Uncharacterized protein FWK35_00006273 [Aphis craccivora]|uniref:Uncharacterized protein n=1 Tax=Aphis craccivora TaxID=307492 RepID=A0A6G0Z161_APHCR|nr:Uncharacterized protein FWK35_00006273 [Aphis craccivora]